MGIYSMFGFLAGPLGYVVEFMYNLLKNYGWTIILFTLIVRVAMFPLSLKQQKSTARMAAYQPMIQEIQKKYPNDRNKQNEEMQKFYAENNIKMSAGCLPMIVNMIVLFGMIAVIQAPLTYILHMPEEQVASGVAVVRNYEEAQKEGASEDEIKAIDEKIKHLDNPYTQQSILIGEMKSTDPDHYEAFVEGVDVKGEDGTTSHDAVSAEWVENVRDFNFEFLGFDLSAVPTFSLNKYLVLPILSVLTMFASQFIIMRTSGSTQQQGSMWIMTIVMGLFFGYYAFTVPVGFSLYYTVSNIVMTLQQLVVKRIYDPVKIKEELLAQIEENKKAKKAKKTVALATADGGVITKEMSEKDITRLRLERARMQDAEKYGIDEAPPPVDDDLDDFGDDEAVRGEFVPDEDAGESDVTDVDETQAEETGAEAKTQPAADYKPGRRRRATIGKEKEESQPEKEAASFAEQEMKKEKRKDASGREE